MAMKVLQRILFVSGALLLFAGVTGIQHYSWQSGYGSTVVYYHGWQRLLPITFALFAFGWLIMIRNRHISGWYIGCGVCLLAIVQFVHQGILPLLAAPASFDGWWPFVSQLICAMLVGIAFKKLWLPKKAQWFQAKA